jgi:transcriptional regulator with XRE-family HTH domain
MTTTTPGERMRTARTAINMSLTDLAHRTFIDIDKLSKIEHNKREIGGAEMVTIASVLGVRPADLLYEPSQTFLRGHSRRPGGKEALGLFDEFIKDWEMLEGIATMYEGEPATDRSLIG